MYLELRKHLADTQLLIGMTSTEVVLFYSDKHELIILPNGTLFMSESLFEEVLKQGGLEGLSFVLLHELSHLIKSHLRSNLIYQNKFGDLKR